MQVSLADYSAYLLVAHFDLDLYLQIYFRVISEFQIMIL